MTNALGYPSYNINGVIPFNLGSPTGLDANTCVWWLDAGIDGWDSPTNRVTMLTRIGKDPLADGEIPADLHYRGRTLMFTLYAECPSEAAREEAWYLAAQATDLIDSTGTFYANEVVPKQLTVVRSGNQNQGRLTMLEQGLTLPASISQGLVGLPPGKQIWLLKADFELYCQDPRKYAQTPTTGSSGSSITNDGNTASGNGLIEIPTTGGGRGPITVAIGTRGMQLVVPTVPAGPALPNIPTELVINLLTKTIRDGTGNDYYYLRNLQTPWLIIPRGTSSFVSSHAATINYRTAWI